MASLSGFCFIFLIFLGYKCLLYLDYSSVTPVLYLGENRHT